jgi:hypothetical protein
VDLKVTIISFHRRASRVVTASRVLAGASVDRAAMISTFRPPSGPQQLVPRTAVASEPRDFLHHTWMKPEVRRLMIECVDKNMIDKDEYPQTAEIERRRVHMLADLWNSPRAANTLGCSTTGSSEAAMLGGHGAQMAVTRTAACRRQADGQTQSCHRPGAGPLA